MNLSQLRSQIYSKLGENSDQTEFINNTIIDSFINEAYFELAVMTKSIWGQNDISIKTNKTYISLPDNEVLKLERIFYNGSGNKRLIKHKTYGYLDDTQEAWEANSYGIPEYCYLYELDRIRFERGVNTDTSIRVDYIKMPTELSTSTDIPVIDTVLHECIVLFALYKILLLEEVDDKLEEAQAYYNEYSIKLYNFKKSSLKRKRGRQAKFG